LFFDERWNSKSNAISFGHDIECSWLLQEAAEVLGDEILLEKVNAIALEMAQVILENGFDSTGGIMYEKENNHFDKEKHWWVQAEAMVGFFNAYEISKEEKYLEASLNCWKFIKKNILDKENGEWVWSVLENGKSNTLEDKAGTWKAPYHNGRMCLELIRRMNM
jgi:mannobiose 2-epimerase